MVDPARLRSLLERLRAEVDDLRRLAQLDRSILLADRDKLKSVKYGFVVAIEVLIDAGNHIIASQGYGHRPATATSSSSSASTITSTPTTCRGSSRWPAFATFSCTATPK